MNAYDYLLWWEKLLWSCHNEIQLKNALRLWPQILKRVPCYSDAWCIVVDVYQHKHDRIVPPLPTGYVNYVPRVKHPLTYREVIKRVYFSTPPGAE